MRSSFSLFVVGASFLVAAAAAEETPAPANLGGSIGAPPSSKGKAFNPDIGANFLGLWDRGTGLSNDRTQVPRNGFSVQEAELQFTADVDPYFHGVALFSLAQDAGTTEYAIDPEEIFIETLSLPQVIVRAGKFKLALGKHNSLHTHAFPFIDAPLIHQRLLGDEGLNETGVSAAVLVPAPWYSELVLQAFDASNPDLYDARNSGDLAGLARWKNLFELTDDLTTEFGLSGSTGKNQFGHSSSIGAADLTFKWRPAVGGKYHALVWSTEYLDAFRKGRLDSAGLSDEKLGGYASWLQVQFAERWWIQGRFEQVGLPRSEAAIQTRESALIGFFPSEFSGLRLQYDHLNEGSRPGRTDHTLTFQYNISIGAHPAHAY